MKIRSLAEFDSAIDRDFSWRKQEITTIKFSIKGARSHQVDVFFRGGVVLLYAHWEGLIKFSAKAYLAYINRLSPSYSSMRPCFRYFAVHEMLENSSKLNFKNFDVFEGALNFFTAPCNLTFAVNAESYISTKENQNLTAGEFRMITRKLGLTYLPMYELREKLIDEQLLKYRNKIAHGESLREEILDPEETFEVLSDKVLGLLESWNEQLRNSIQLKSFLV